MFVLSASLLFGQQISLINKTASDKSSKILYLGLDNELEVQCETLKGIVPQSGVSLTQNKLSIKPTVIGKLTIVILTNNGENPITFDVRVVPDPIPVVTGHPSKEIIKIYFQVKVSYQLRLSIMKTDFMITTKLSPSVLL